MKFELRKAKSGDYLLIVVFEQTTNYTPETHEWVPKFEELEQIQEILKKISPWK